MLWPRIIQHTESDSFDTCLPSTDTRVTCPSGLEPAAMGFPMRLPSPSSDLAGCSLTDTARHKPDRGLRGRCSQQEKQWKRQTWKHMKRIDRSGGGGERLHWSWSVLKHAVKHGEGGTVCRGSLTDQRLTTPFNKHFFISLVLTKALCPMPRKPEQNSNSETAQFFLLQSSIPPITS